MKSTLLIICSVLALSFISCESEPDPEPQTMSITDEEAVDLVAGALATDTEGLTQEALDAATVADNYAEKSGGNPCEMVFDSTVERTIDNAVITASYGSFWTWELVCNDFQIPETLLYQRTSDGSYTSNRLESIDSATGNWTVDNLFGGGPYAVNGTYQRTGTQQSLVHNQSEFTSEILIEVEDLIIDKDDKRLESGQASFTLTGDVTDGESFSLQGDIIFLGDMAATLIINGNVYTIEL